jgi:hypothetical protein
MKILCPKINFFQRQFAISRLTIIALSIAVLTLMPTKAQSASIKDGLVAYYPFNGDANDESENAIHAQVTDLVPTDDRFGIPNAAFRFNGSSSSVIRTDPVFNLGQPEYTVSVWIRSEDVTQRNQTIFNTMPHNGIDIVLNHDVAVNSIHHRIGDISKWITEPLRGTKQNYESKEWYHIVYVKLGTTYRSYVNGIVDNTANVDAAKGFNYGVGFRIGSIGNSPQTGSEYFKGDLDDIRIYSRALSDSEVLALYQIESQPPTTQRPQDPFSATANAQVVNGFVVGIAVIDGGNGYADTPRVQIIGGGGTGATAEATVINGGVSLITVTNPGANYTSTPDVQIELPPRPPHRASATAEVVNGFLVKINIIDHGFGYETPPAVRIIDSEGNSATAEAIVSNGIVTGFTITSPGKAYSDTPSVIIASPPFAPELSVAVSKVRVTMSVVLGKRYQLFSTPDLATWSPIGGSFVAEAELLEQELDVIEVGHFFRLQELP